MSESILMSCHRSRTEEQIMVAVKTETPWELIAR